MAATAPKTPQTQIPEKVPDYVVQYAPLVHVFSEDPYLPSSMAAQVANTRPQMSFKDAPVAKPPLDLSNLDQLNALGSDVYLTSNQDITTNPSFLNGIKPDTTGSTGVDRSSVIVVVDKGSQKEGATVDAFYFYFCAYNWGGVVLGKQLGDHVGDWEHNMIRFINGQPRYVWYSQHSNGEAFKYSILKKDKSGKRPLAFSANGSHALYPTAGTYDHTIPNLNLPFQLLLVDETDQGPVYDPTLSAYFVKYVVAPPGTKASASAEIEGEAGKSAFEAYFEAYDASTPLGFLRYKGKWGDEQYPDSDKRQLQLLGNRKFVSGPTGPADKQLDRKEVWPESSYSKGQYIRGSLGSWGKGKNLGDVIKNGVTRCFAGRQGKAKTKVVRMKVDGSIIT